MEKSKKYLNTICSFKTQDPEAIHKIAVTLCELREHKKANQVLKQLLRYKPYDIRILHYVAVSYFNLGLYNQAYKYWSKTGRIDPDNNISNYYTKLAQDCLAGNGDRKELSYHFQVPYDEILRRIKKLNEILKLDEGDLLIKWKNHDSFRALLSWGLDLNDELIKKAILNVVASFGDEKAETFLREFLIRVNENEELKTEALGLLKQMSAPEPYIAYVDDDLVQVKVDIIGDGSFEMPLEMGLVLEIAIEKMQGRYEQGFEEDLREIWFKFVMALYPDDLPQIRKYEGWAAALELYYCFDYDINVKKGAISDHYGITPSTLYNNYNRLRDVLMTMEP